MKFSVVVLAFLVAAPCVVAKDKHKATPEEKAEKAERRREMGRRMFGAGQIISRQANENSRAYTPTTTHCTSQNVGGQIQTNCSSY